MPQATHPLGGNEKWKFSQPDVGVRGHYLSVEPKTGEKQLHTVETASTCREGVITNVRSGFQMRLTNLEEHQRSKNAWNDSGSERTPWKATRDADLVDLAGKEKPAQLKIQWHQAWMKGWENFPVEKFIKVCDAVIGPVAVLLGPWRPEGDTWWRTDPLNCVVGPEEGTYVYWSGTDSWFLAHPAVIAIATGLYRQCFHLCGAGVADEIIGSISEDEITEVMSTNSQRLALLLIKRTRPWIEVPVGINGSRVNYPFPLGFWRRLVRLQRAIRRDGYEEALGQSFHEGWATTGGTKFRGVYSFWGEEGELTDHHRHLMQAGAPRRKKSDKPASRTA